MQTGISRKDGQEYLLEAVTTELTWKKQENQPFPDQELRIKQTG